MSVAPMDPVPTAYPGVWEVILTEPLRVSRILDMDPLTRLREATEARAKAESEWRDAIRDAMDAASRAEHEYSVADVVTAAGVSRPRVYQIVEGR